MTRFTFWLLTTMLQGMTCYYGKEIENIPCMHICEEDSWGQFECCFKSKLFSYMIRILYAYLCACAFICIRVNMSSTFALVLIWKFGRICINFFVVSSNLFFLGCLQVVTFWEGEIVDTKNYTFYTGKWEATYYSLCLSLFFLFSFC